MTPPDPAVAEIPLRGLPRLMAGLRKPANWLQLIQFGIVGGSGFVINTAVFAVANKSFGVHYVYAATLAFLAAVTNNFTWNRLWTFRHRRDASHAAFQAARFFVVAVTAYFIGLGLLALFVEAAGMDALVAQVIAVILVTPISFLGNKLWSFK